MATFIRPDVLSADIANKVHDFDSDTFRLLLTNTAPVVSTSFLLSNVTATQLATANGYIQSADGAGKAVALAFTRSGQVTTVSITTPSVWTATGAVGPFRYIVFWNDTPTTPLNPIIGWLDIVTPVTLANTDTYTVPAVAAFTIG